MGQAETSDSLSKANISFTLDLFKTLGNQNKTSNVSFSPFSVSAALSMLLLGAKGSTANQMREVGLKGTNVFMLFPFLVHPQCLKTKNCQDVHSSFAALLKELKNTDSLDVLSVANRLYGDQSCKFIKVIAMSLEIPKNTLHLLLYIIILDIVKQH
uniref:Serpin domain-containing protein n=1 Tax=Periophthalmus magnuspinnatus TaxID=409849 RepID=A0A3B4AU17_9GOBI